MLDTEIMPILLTNLNMSIPSTGRSTIQQNIINELSMMIGSAKNNLAMNGIVLPDGTTEEYSDAQADLIITYAAYLYRNRQDGTGMTAMLKSKINDMLFHQKGQVTDEE